MTARTVDTDQVLELMERAVHVRGSEHTASRAYIDEHGHRCIVGEVLHALGIPDDVMRGWTLRIGAVRAIGGLRQLTDGALAALEIAQDVQDGHAYKDVTGNTWGDALAAARRAVAA